MLDPGVPKPSSLIFILDHGHAIVAYALTIRSLAVLKISPLSLSTAPFASNSCVPFVESRYTFLSESSSRGSNAAINRDRG
jgi:hypothetical protein